MAGLPVFELERYFARWEFAAPHLLCTSDVEGWRMDELLSLADEEGLSLWHDLRLGYTESPGHPLLREEIARLYDRVEPDDVLVFAGAEEAVFALMNVLLGPGDHAVVVWPAYQSLHEVARSAGGEVTLLPLDEDAGWALELDVLGRELRPKTKAIVANFPHNPTGTHLDLASFERLVRLADERGATLVSDEVYRFLEHDEADRLPGASDLSDRAVSVGVMSKSFALAGLRIGWIATRDRELLGRLATFKDYTTICSSAPSEILALIALRAREAVLARSREIVRGNLVLLDELFATHADRIAWARPRAGSIAFPRLLDDVPVDELAARLVEEEGVLILPGTVFGDTRNHFRIGFGRTDMPDAVERLSRFLERS